MDAGRPFIVAAVAAAALGAAGRAAAAPPNDAYERATPLPASGATVAGTTRGAGVSEAEPLPGCARARGIVWYTTRAPRRGPMVVRLKAAGNLDAAVAVFRVLRTTRRQIACGRTNAHGNAALSWYGFREGSYAIAVVQRLGSAADAFRLATIPAEPAPRPPGTPIPAAGIRTTVDPILDSSDAWAVQMDRGRTYRINVTMPSDCLAVAVYRPGVYSFARAKPVATMRCDGYRLFTPGIDGGGVYSVVVRARGTEPVRRAYRIQVAPAGPDDTAPGVGLANGAVVSGSIFGRGVDVVDLYRFAVPRPNELTTIALGQRPNVGLDLVVLNESGGRVASVTEGKGRQVLREHLPPGRYFLAVRSREGSGGRYRLTLLIRDVTTTHVSSTGGAFTEVPPGTPVPVTVTVTSASHGGRVQLEFDRHDPLAGWQFASAQVVRIDPAGVLTVPWTPPSVGHWRVRARFLGTPFSSFSESGYAYVHVAAPLE